MTNDQKFKNVMYYIIIFFLASLVLLEIYNYNIPHIKRMGDKTTITYKRFSITTCQQLGKDIKIERVREHVPKLDGVCEFIKIIDN